MAGKLKIAAGLGRLPSALLADGLGTPFGLEELSLTIEMIGIPSAEAFGNPIIITKRVSRLVGDGAWEYPKEQIEIPATIIVFGLLLGSSIGVVQAVGGSSKQVLGELARFEVGNVIGWGSSTAKIINIVNLEIFSYNNIIVESGASKRKKRREQEVVETILLAA
jgi:hypothetical protein